MQTKILLVIVIALSLTLASALAEWKFDAPYTGAFTRAPAREIAKATNAADYIILTKSLEINTAEPKRYVGRHDVVGLLKGRIDGPIKLDWDPSATGISSATCGVWKSRSEAAC